MNPVDQIPIKSVSWWNSLQHAIERLLEQMHLTSQDIVHISSFIIGGIVVGFLFKKYLKYFLIFVLLFVLVLVALDHYHVVTVNWSMAGIDSELTIQPTIHAVLIMVRDNVALAIGSFVGFLVGYSIG